MDPTAATFVEFIGERTDVLTMAVVITGDITAPIIGPTIMGLIVATCAEFIVVHTEGAITDPLGRPCGSPCCNLKPRAKRNWRPVVIGSDASSVAFSTRPGGTLYGPFGGYDGWWFWPRRRH